MLATVLFGRVVENQPTEGAFVWCHYFSQVVRNAVIISTSIFAQRIC